jgi:transforming growth factor-beta-induced protein
MKTVTGFLAVAVLAVSVVGCSDSTSPAAPSSAMSTSAATTGSSSFAAKSGRAALPTIVGIATAPENIGTFSTLVAALQKAGLVDTFNGSQQFTVFAPTNDAFDAAAAALLGAGKTGLDLVNALDVATLTAVLKYHVAQGDRTAQAVLSSGQVRMLDGNFAPVTVANGEAFIAGAKILKTDITASNGIIHVIGSVMLPPSGK